MQMRADVQISSVIKALNDVILPSIDPENKLAQEQARLIIGLMSLMRQQLPLQFRYDCDELARSIALAKQLLPLMVAESEVCRDLGGFSESIASADAVLSRAKADPAEVYEAVRMLRAATGEIVARACRASDSMLSAISKPVLSASAEQVLRERSWVLMQGWEPDPSSVPPIAELL